MKSIEEIAKGIQKDTQRANTDTSSNIRRNGGNMKKGKTKAELLVIRAGMIKRKNRMFAQMNSTFVGKAAKRRANSVYLSLTTDITRINCRLLEIEEKSSG